MIFVEKLWSKEQISNFVRKFLASKLILIFNHSLYSPDLASCNYFLFSKLKIKLKKKQFITIFDIQKALAKAISTISKEDFLQNFLKLYDCCKHCISSEGMYLE